MASTRARASDDVHVGRTPASDDAVQDDAELECSRSVSKARRLRHAETALGPEGLIQRRSSTDFPDGRPLRKIQSEKPRPCPEWSLSIDFVRTENDRRAIQLDVSYTLPRRPTRHVSCTLELRQLLFWFVLLAVVATPVSGLKVTPFGRTMVNQGAHRHMRRVHEGMETISEALGSAPAQVDISDPLLDEISGMVAKEAQGFLTMLPGAASDQMGDGTFSAVVGHLTRFVSTGELSMDGLKNTATKACLSALMHKAAMGAIDHGSELAAHVGHCLPHAVHLFG